MGDGKVMVKQLLCILSIYTFNASHTVDTLQIMCFEHKEEMNRRMGKGQMVKVLNVQEFVLHCSGDEEIEKMFNGGLMYFNK